MHFSGAGLGEMGHGAVPAHGNCNPRKFSEKIALHNQRQAEETAAFREVMMDITSIRVQAKRVRQTRDLLPYYGGSLPNVNQISRCSTETQQIGQRSEMERQNGLGWERRPTQTTSPLNYPSYLTQQLLEADEEYRDVQPSPLSRPHRRPFESAPYLSTHLSPPRAPVWRRNWSTCSATEKSQMVTLPLTALNRTNSDSALHTSVRNTQFHGHQRSSQSRHRGFVHPAPLIEENIQEETRSPKLKRFSSVGSSGCETPAVHSFPLSDQQQTSSLSIPSSLSVSGSLPDLSSLHLPSPLPSAPELEPQTRADPLSTANTEPGIVTDFSLPALSSSLQPSLSIPLLQSSVSNPNIQSCLSTHSLPASLSSTSLRLSLSNHSLQSSLSSSSLSSQSLHSSGFGGSGSSTSSSGSPRVTSGSFGSSFSGSPRVNLGSSRKRAQISPLIVPSGDTRWQHPKQFSPTASPTLSSVSQGAFLNSSKAPKDTKPPAYPCPPQLRSPHLSHQPLRHYFHLEGQHQSIPEIPEQWIQHDAQQQTHVQRQQLFHKHCQQLQHQTQQPSQAFPQIQPLYPEQISEEQHHWRLSSMKNTQSLHGFTSSVQEDQWGHRRASPEQQQTQGKRRYCLQEEAEEATPAESQAEAAALQQQCNESIPGSQEKDFVLNKDSYVGLHLTPSQAKALSQQLGTLQKDPAGGSRESELKRETVESSSADPEPPPQSLSCGGGETHSLFNINLTDTSCWLDQDFSGLPDSVLEFDLESFGLDSNLGWP